MNADLQEIPGIVDPETLAGGAHPAITPRLVVPGTETGPLPLAAERALGTYGPVRAADVVAELAAAGLRGRGGAAFPAHLKWTAVAAAPGPTVVLANGEEGEPASAKDRWLLVHRPHLVIDGLLLAARTVGATRAVLYLSHAATVAAVRAALAELGRHSPADVHVDVHVVQHAYIAGEETAACSAVSGGDALPKAKPPRPHEQGVDGLPTLVANVETLAHAAWIARHGAAAYRAHGTSTSPGTTLMTLGGAVRRCGVYEVPYGPSVRDLVTAVAGGFAGPPTGYLMGGWFGGVLAAGRGDAACCYDAIRAAGSGLGCAAVTVLGEHDDPVTVAAAVAAWYARESSGQCGVCIRGTAAIRDALAALRDGTASGDEPANLARWGTALPRRGACAFLDGSASLARTVVTEFPDAVHRRATHHRASHHRASHHNDISGGPA
ncbi:NADH-ubiquinone oxidoreductase-F iron-sulfur binding region domain-containing protein [Pseudonocardia sp.]|uniref:NADH-ubiquinone oxidoreductase-F iron-sulfur binding region domain-containing protein n=1 Tax=Pseudonocardia sp. TaxID=60912 RepID=UPI003D0C6464